MQKLKIIYKKQECLEDSAYDKYKVRESQTTEAGAVTLDANIAYLDRVLQTFSTDDREDQKVADIHRPQRTCLSYKENG